MWNEENKKSVAFCEKLIRTREIDNYIEKMVEKLTMEDLKSHGSHVELDGTTYITPMCCEHNTSNKGLKKGTILVEEVDPLIIDED